VPGDSEIGAAVQFLTSERGSVHGDVSPLFDDARTRHQYVPFGSVFLSVARVLRVEKLPSPRPRTGELKFRSAETWNSYVSAPGTGFHEKPGSASTVAPGPGSARTGVGSAAWAGAVRRSAAPASAATTVALGTWLRAMESGGESVADSPFPSRRWT
jgi:hypothetical protein